MIRSHFVSFSSLYIKFTPASPFQSLGLYINNGKLDKVFNFLTLFAIFLFHFSICISMIYFVFPYGFVKPIPTLLSSSEGGSSLP